SRSPRPADTHAAYSARPASLIQDRSSTVLPLPAGADTTLTRAIPRRSNSLGRETMPPEPGPAAPPATGSDPATDSMVPIIAPRQPTCPGAVRGDADRRHTPGTAHRPGRRHRRRATTRAEHPHLHRYLAT